ncbi:tetratricopeptide repeat-containing sulfotransferase family protein [Roseibium sp. SCP14]|uniref:tetratricopeptide repeat-containing sulfotransferase family protein n=1 Tax=Roseibium sp. SCP14 TaxID=3141375 RepID=UPI003334EBF3
MSLEVERLVQTALSHQHAGRISLAFELFEEVLRLEPHNPQANFSLGIAAYQTGDVGLAIARLQTAARKASKHPQVHQLLGLALMNVGDLDAAHKSLKKAVSLGPKVADFHAQIGDLYRLKRQPVLARQSFERALKLDAENGYALVGMGQLEITIGKIEEAVEWFERAVAVGKELPSALQCLTMTRTYQDRPDELNLIEDLLKNARELAAPEQANLHWAAGKVHYDLGDSLRAVQHYRSARRLRYAEFDNTAHEERIAFMKEVFSEDFFSSRLEVGNESERPIFIFGMPRSGTTLVEQIFSRHSSVASGAEIPFFRHLQQDIGLTRAPSSALEFRLKSMDPRDFKRIARNYLTVLDSNDRRSDRVTDKMPHNFEMLWLMGLLFPKAAFIHCVRCPADTSISLLSHALSPAHNYCISQKSVGRYFRTYTDLMEHWTKVLPVELHRLSYEDLVHSQETESRDLLAQAGLPWEEECLEFYKGDSPVTTFSNLQVRRPIFRSSIGRWRRYRDLLTDLFDALGPLAPAELRNEDDQRLTSVAGEMSGSPDNDVLRRKENAAG